MKLSPSALRTVTLAAPRILQVALVERAKRVCDGRSSIVRYQEGNPAPSLKREARAFPGCFVAQAPFTHSAAVSTPGPGT